MSETRSMHTVPRGYSQLSLIRRRKLLYHGATGSWASWTPSHLGRYLSIPALRVHEPILAQRGFRNRNGERVPPVSAILRVPDDPPGGGGKRASRKPFVARWLPLFCSAASRFPAWAPSIYLN